jgi:hypothetical protein
MCFALTSPERLEHGDVQVLAALALYSQRIIVAGATYRREASHMAEYVGTANLMVPVRGTASFDFRFFKARQTHRLWSIRCRIFLGF